MDLLNQLFADLWGTFFSPDKRVFVGYLFSALIMALAWLMLRQKNTFFTSVRKIFSLNIWWSPSAKIDYKIFFINKCLMVMFSPLLLAQISVASFIFYQLHEWFPDRPQFFTAWSDFSVALIFTACYFLLDDFMRFYVHRLLHRVPFLWDFHKVHHTAEVLTPLTVFRTHPIETIIFSLRSIFTQAVAIAVLVFFLGDRADVMTVLGAHVFVFVFNVLGANLRHSHVAIGYWRSLERWVISPAQHQIHHSVAHRHHDKNYGVVLAIWDLLAGSHHYSEKNQDLVFGLSQGHAGHHPHRLYDVYCRPFVEIFCRTVRAFKRTYQ
jgi:sterol desaturase/sphingolipid hydroxylase (fatty acid hydroxylase superfamily)